MTRILTPDARPAEQFTDAAAAVARLIELYSQATGFLSAHFQKAMDSAAPETRIRAFYPEIRFTTSSYAQVDSRLSFGHVSSPGTFSATITRPELFKHYLTQQIRLLIENHGQPVTIAVSDTPIPVHFAVSNDDSVTIPQEGAADFTLRDVFDVPDLSTTNDDIVNGTYLPLDNVRPLAPFTAQRVDYSLARLTHYTATDPEHFQSHVLFTNYQFYVTEFEEYARAMLRDPDSGYTSFVSTGNVEISNGDAPLPASVKTPQMPTYHLKRANGSGITLVNIGVGPSNAKTICDHLAVLRPEAWLMIGHCGGLRPSQRIGDYVLAHAYLRDDKVLDAMLPPEIPVPAIAEVQVAMATAAETVLGGNDPEDFKRRLRTGTVVTTDDRNWELRYSHSALRFSLSRAVGIDMESATIAAQGYRFRVPYGTLLCVSDKPIHGELKLPGQANRFYEEAIAGHLRVGIMTCELLRQQGAKLHSRKLRAFNEPPFR